MHDEEEFRYIISGGGYWDVRGSVFFFFEVPALPAISITDRLRVLTVCRSPHRGVDSDFYVQPGDVIVITPGLYHRFNSRLTNRIR